MILVFDSETTGFPNPNLPPDHATQPHLVQLGCILAEEDGTQRAVIDLIIKPEGYEIPETAAKVHGITTEISTHIGIPLAIVINTFLYLRSRADIIVAHNLPFDEAIMATAIHRSGISIIPLGVSQHGACTMSMSEPILKLPATEKMRAAGRAHQFKKPSLKECYQHFFSEELRGAHTALADAQACARIYFAIIERTKSGVLPPVQGGK